MVTITEQPTPAHMLDANNFQWSQWSDKELFARTLLGLGPIVRHLPTVHLRYEEITAGVAFDALSEEELATHFDTIVSEVASKNGDLALVQNIANIKEDPEKLANLYDAMTAPADEWLENAAQTPMSDIEFIFSHIEAEKPGFIAYYANQIRSGDHVQMQKAITQASTILNSIKPKITNALNSSNKTMPGTHCVAVALTITIAYSIAAAAVTAVAAVNVAVYFAALFYPNYVPMDQESTLLSETLIDDIAALSY